MRDGGRVQHSELVGRHEAALDVDDVELLKGEWVLGVGDVADELEELEGVDWVGELWVVLEG